MIINFTVGNYRSFRDKKVLSMEATAIKELNESIIKRDGYKLLPSAVIYGANSSGKSNLLKAIGKFTEIISTSSKLNSTDKLNITPFLLNPHTAQTPSYFEIELLIDKQIYTYGFTADNQKVYEEWLYVKQGKNQKEICLFGRIEEGIGIGDEYSEGVGLEEKVRDGSFRRDLYYRLNTLPVLIPPLCRRGEDVFLLMERFCRELKGEFVLSEEVKKIFRTYSWPGNIRELRNLAEYFCFTGSQVITVKDLPPTFQYDGIGTGLSYCVSKKAEYPEPVLQPDTAPWEAFAW